MRERDSMLLRLLVRVYAAAAVVLPRPFRAEYGDELSACFTRIVSEARRRRGRMGAVMVTVRAIADLASSAPVQHLAAARAELLGSGSSWAGSWQDVRHAGRRLVRSPAFSMTSVLTLGLGIAAAAAVFSLVHGVLLRPLPYPQSARLVQVDHRGPGVGVERGLGITFGFYRLYAERSVQAEALAMYSWLEQTLTGAGEPVRLRGVRATPSLLNVLRVPPRLGRWFTAEEGQTGAPLTVVLSDRLWRERFGADRDVLGRSIELGGVAREVVGVMPATFAFPSAEASFWLPRVVPATGVGGWNEQAIARLAPGADPASLERELASLFPLLRETTDDPAIVSTYLDDARVAPRIVSLKEHVVGDVAATLWILLGTVGLVLLIAVANVANLFLVRAEESQREVAVRLAVGANRARLVRSYMAETLLLALAACAVGVVAAGAAVGILRQRAPVNIPRLDEVGLSVPVLAVALGTALVAAVLLGLIPALRQQGGAADILVEAGRRSTSGRTRRRGRDILMATQIALALVLLVGSGLLFRTFRELRAVELGFHTRQALVFDLGLPGTRYPERADGVRFQRELLEQLRALPGVASVGAVGRCLPLSGSMCWGETLEAEGRPTTPGQVPPVTGARVATAEYFQTIGIPVRGRTFRTEDERGNATVAILSEAAAAAYFPGEDPIGRRIRFGSESPWHTVVGVAADVRGRVDERERAGDLLRLIYLPMLPEGENGPGPEQMAFVVATSLPPHALVDEVRRTVTGLDPAIPLANVGTMQQHIDRATAPTAFALTLIGLASAIALLLGAVGVYAVVTYAVSRRTAEIGVRMALGARAVDVRTMVLRQSGLVVLAGVALGLTAAFALTQLMTGLLHGVSPSDPLSYLSVTALLLVIAGVAIWLPAHRAARVDPLEALRSD